MRAAQMKERPDFPLMRQTDVQQIYHMQMPRWLFSDRRYSDMSLEAKVAYTFLLNRFQLSRRNGWGNEWGEVFVIFPRKELAAELRVCEQRVTAAFRTLVERKLIWEKRCGRGDANQIYLASVSPVDDPDYASAPFLPEDNSRSSRTAGSEVLAPLPPTGPSQEPRQPRPQDHGSSGFRTAESEVPEPQDSGPSYTDLREPDRSHMEVSPPFPRACAVRLADEEAELTGILEACELECFEPEVARVFENAIERLFYTQECRIGKAVLPQANVRSRLWDLDSTILQSVEGKLRQNQRNVKNSTAYTMAVIFNAICESQSDLLLDPYLNSIGGAPAGSEKGGENQCF